MSTLKAAALQAGTSLTDAMRNFYQAKGTLQVSRARQAPDTADVDWAPIFHQPWDVQVDSTKARTAKRWTSLSLDPWYVLRCALSVIET